MTDAVRRAVLIVGVLAILVGVGVAAGGSGSGASTNSTAGGSKASAGDRVAAVSGTGVSAIGAESSAWFCAGGTSSGGNAQATMIVNNPTPRAVTGTVTTVSTAGAPFSTSIPVPAHSEQAVSPTAGAAPGATVSTAGRALASTVVFNGGGVGVTQVVSGPLGFSNAPCGSRTAGHWYFADGSTAKGDTLTLSLFNPTATVAVVNVTFVSSTGVLAPPAYQGIEIAAGRLVTENIGDHIMNNPDVATEVVALSGQVVAAELEAAGPAGRGGPSVVLGARTPATTWSFAQTTEVTKGTTLFHLYNPSTRAARVTVRIGLEQGAAEPFVVRVAPESVATLDTTRLPRVPADTPFAVTFVSGGGVGIVVDRHVAAPAGAPSAGPDAPDVGDVAGVPGGALRWLVPSEWQASTGVASLAVVDLERSALDVRLMMLTSSGLVPAPGFGRRRVAPGLPLIVSPTAGSPVQTEPLELVADGPVAVEVDAGPAGSPGVVVTPALPLRS